MITHYLNIDPVAKPRMTQRDKWKKRPIVLRYRAFCDDVRLQMGGAPFPPVGAHVVFHVPMPKSWSKKKRREMDGKPHEQRPDVDNFLKALLDALCDDDAHIYDVRISKYWSESGAVMIKENINQPMRKAA